MLTFVIMTFASYSYLRRVRNIIISSRAQLPVGGMVMGEMVTGRSDEGETVCASDLKGFRVASVANNVLNYPGVSLSLRGRKCGGIGGGADITRMVSLLLWGNGQGRGQGGIGWLGDVGLFVSLGVEGTFVFVLLDVCFLS